MERQRDEIANEQDARWLATASKSKAKRDAHEANKAHLIHTLEEKHFGEARAEWQVRLELARLSDEAWGDMTAEEQFAISKALGGDLDEEDEDPVFAEVFMAPQQPQSSAVAPGPVPILSSASRSSNFSTSSYTLVSPADLGSDDELYAAVSSYIVVGLSAMPLGSLHVVDHEIGTIDSPPTNQTMKLPPYPFLYKTAKVGVLIPAGAHGHPVRAL
jgi:hypothetical protein